MKLVHTPNKSGQWSRVDDRYELANGMVLHHTYFLGEYAARNAGYLKKQGAIYVSGAKEPTLFDSILKHTRRDEDREMDAAWDAHNKLVVEYERDEFAKVRASEDYLELPENLRAVLDGKLRFDRHAGCTCSCSPGWLGTRRDVLGYGGSLHISNLAYEEEGKRKMAEAQAERERQAAERGFESVQAMQKADAEEWAAKSAAAWDEQLARANAEREATEALDAEAERQRLILADRYSEDLVAN